MQPATDSLNKMVEHMATLGWNRLEYDPLNPGLK
jgi:hypothetical protein